MYTITIFAQSGWWHTRHDDPEVLELFGVDVLPTPFSASTPLEDVITAIKRKNPDRRICVVS